MLNIFLKIIINYLVVQSSIILFMLPFYLQYRYRLTLKGELKIDFNRHLEYFFASKYANWLVFFWAMGEAVIWFVIPEFLLLLVVFMRIKRKRELLFYDIYGTTIGTLLAFIIHLPERQIVLLPYVHISMLEQVKHWFSQLGIFGLIYQPFSGVPYKVFTYIAPEYHFFLPAFLIFAVIVRISRYYIAYAILTTVYPVLHKYVFRNYVRLFIIATFIFSILLLKVYTSYGHGLSH